MPLPKSRSADNRGTTGKEFKSSSIKNQVNNKTRRRDASIENRKGLKENELLEKRESFDLEKEVGEQEEIVQQDLNSKLPQFVELQTQVEQQFAGDITINELSSASERAAAIFITANGLNIDELSDDPNILYEQLRAVATENLRLQSERSGLDVQIQTSQQLINALFGKGVIELLKIKKLTYRDCTEIQQATVQGENSQRLANLITKVYESTLTDPNDIESTSLYPDNTVKRDKAIRNYKASVSLLQDFASKNCYICGGPLADANVELEHICPVAEALGILTIIQEGMRDFSKIIYDANDFIFSDDAYGALLEYRDSHLCCNREKSSTSFLKETSTVGYEIDEITIKAFLGQLYDTIITRSNHNYQEGCANRTLQQWIRTFGDREDFINKRYNTVGTLDPNGVRVPGLEEYIVNIVSFVNLNFQQNGSLAYLINISKQALCSDTKLFTCLVESTGDPLLVEKLRIQTLNDEAARAALNAVVVPEINAQELLSIISPLWKKLIKEEKNSYTLIRDTALNYLLVDINGNLQRELGIQLFQPLLMSNPEYYFADGREAPSIYYSDGRKINSANLKRGLNALYLQYKQNYITACLARSGYYYQSFTTFFQTYDDTFFIDNLEKNNYFFGMDYIIKLMTVPNFSIPSTNAAATTKILREFMTNFAIYNDIYIFLHIILTMWSSVPGIPPLLDVKLLNDNTFDGFILSTYVNNHNSVVNGILKTSNFSIIPVNSTTNRQDGEPIPLRNMNIKDLNSYQSFMLEQIQTLSVAQFMTSPTFSSSIVSSSPASSAFGTPFGSQPSSQQGSQETFYTAPGSQGSLSSAQSSNSDQSGTYSPVQQGYQFAALGSPSSSQGSTPDTMEGGKRRKKRYTRKIIKRYTKKLHKKKKRINKFRRTKKRKY